jgi:hypothetical protein
VKEELTLHQVEWEVMECPSKNHSTNLIIEALEDWVIVVLEASLPSQNCKTLEDGKDRNSNGRAPPDDRVTNEVNLAVVLAPEVDTTLKNRPRWWARIPSVRFDKTGIRVPHDLLQLPEFTKETRVPVVDLFGAFTKLRVLILLNVPNAVGKGSSLCAGNFLLLRSPLRKLDLVREQNTASHHMNKLELGLDSSDAVLSILSIRHLLDDFNSEEVIGITLEAFITIRRYLVLPFSLGDRWANIMRMETTVGLEVVQLDSVAVLDKSWRALGIPRGRAVDGLPGDVKRLSLVLEKPYVVLILVWVKSDLLLLAASWVHEVVRMKVSALGVVMSDADPATKPNIDRNILHRLGVESSLELGAHESISITGVNQAEEMDTKHGHVKCQWDHNEAEDP